MEGTVFYAFLSAFKSWKNNKDLQARVIFTLTEYPPPSLLKL